MTTLLLVAAERREFDGIRRRLGPTVERKDWGVRFACEGGSNGIRWLMVANGPGRQLAGKAVEGVIGAMGKESIKTIMSTGFCGALDPQLKIGDIVVCDQTPLATSQAFVRGAVTTCDRVAVTAHEKRKLHAATGAIAVDMEAAAVESRARELGVPYACIRVVSDSAVEDLPMDFNRYRTADGNFSRTRIALAAMARPFSVMPALMEFDARCKNASLALGDFLADCRF